MISWLKRSGIQKDEDGAAGTEGDEPQQEVKNDKATPVIEQERGIPSVNDRSFRSRAVAVSFAAIMLAAIALVWIIPTPHTPDKKDKDDPQATKDQRFDDGKSSVVLAPAAPTRPPAPTQQVSLGPDQPTPAATPSTPIQIVPAPDPRAAPSGRPAASLQRPLTPLERRQQSKVLIVGAADKGDTSTSAGLSNNLSYVQAAAMPPSANGSAGMAGSSGSGPLADALRPTTLSGTAASRLADRTFMMTQGTLLDCNLDVAISSAVAGMVKCTLTRSIFGDDRKVVLLERGTELTGQYQGALQQGQNRLFILWTRAKTPAGVLISLASPGTDSLGRSGVEGFVDTHFLERFGAALFLSVIDDGLGILAAQAQNNNGNGNGGSTIVLPQNSQTAAKNAAGIAVENSIRIPPTLNKNQGEHVSIFVARDLDFRTVYAVKATDIGQ